MLHELHAYWLLTEDMGSFATCARDVLGFRFMRLLQIESDDRVRTIRLRGGTALTYRFNRGDIRALAEIWIARAYELSEEARVRNLLDLGANIGATSLWLASRYGASRIVAVEPSPVNARLARHNLSRTGIDSRVLEAAVASRRGTGQFQLSGDSTWGRLGEWGIEVELVTPSDLVELFPADQRVDLVKIDIEGGEGDLFRDGADLGWLQRVDRIVVELHGDLVDTPGICARLEEHGFVRVPLTVRNPYDGPADETAVFVRGERG